jgi:8-oxo-dGTP diphosphatase
VIVEVVGAVILDAQGRLLTVRKRGTSRFMLPGGKREAGEDDLAALARELFEELGVTLLRAEPFGRFEAPAANEPGAVVRSHAYLAATEGEIAIAAEIEELRWIDPAAPDVTLAPLLERHILPSLSTSAMRVHAVRLAPGSDLKAELQRLTTERALRAGCILTGIGSLSRARLRMPGATGEAERFQSFDEPMEIVSLAGTLSPEGLHVHISLSRSDGTCLGGHLVPGCIVHTTAELVIGELPALEFRRPTDAATGYGELSIRPRPPAANPR